ncbi:MAG: 16S rRNA (cytosine(967)-C(5))-methyltransferase RsmB [Candidatus Fimadaptatus sp.]
MADGTPSRRAAHRALGLVTREGAYAGLALDRVLGEAHMSASDRALATEVFYGTLEHMAKIDLLLGQLMARAPEKPVLDVLRISLYQLMYLERVPASAVCDEAVGLTRALGFEGATGMVNGVLRNFVRRRDELKLPAREDGLEGYLAVEYSMPGFVCAALVNQYGAEQAERILAWRGGRHIVLRPNTLRIDAAEFERRLDAAGLRYERSRVPGAYRVYGLGAVDKNALYRQGLFSVQGESSLLCAQVLAPRPGMQVLDACAAPGGKAAALAELMQGAGRVYACDLHAHRVELIRALAARLGHDMIKVRQQDAARFVPDWEQAMDAVLCDVPCSGLGVVAAKPDIRLNITQAELEELPRIQAAILDNSSRYVRPGGTLVYSTCTLLDSENQDVVRAFLERHPEFRLDDVSAYVPECFRAGVRDGMLTLLGCRDDVDGFFIARMVRR